MRRAIFISILFPLAGAGASSHIANFVLTADPQQIQAGEVSNLKLQSQGSDGIEAKLPQTGCLLLGSTSSRGEFSSNSTNWSPVTVLTMNKNTANRSFYYKDTVGGTPTLSVKVALRPEDESRSCASWPQEEWNIQWTATQPITISGETADNSPSTSSSEGSSLSSSSSSIVSPSSSSIKAYAGEDRAAVAGAWVEFRGSAFGLKDEPLDGARFWWNFGDGDTKEGRVVSHIYRFLGVYTVGLHVSSGSYAASDYLAVTVVPNKLAISGVLQGEDGFVRLKNNSDTEIEFGGWSIEDGSGKKFIVPPRTKVGANAEVSFPNEITGLLGSGQTVSLVVRYPDSRVALRRDGPETISAVTTERSASSLVPKAVIAESKVSEVTPSNNDGASLISAGEAQEPSREAARVSGSSAGPALFLTLAFFLALVGAIGFILVRQYGKT